jgi:acyl-coenzyme A synthetase/AMP-(fatty) acid ligase
LSATFGTTAFDAVATTAAVDPDRLAVASRERRVTYEKLLRLTEAAAKWLDRDDQRYYALRAECPIDVAVAILSAEVTGTTLPLLDRTAPPAEQRETATRFGATGIVASFGTSPVERLPNPDAGPPMVAPGLGLRTSGVTGTPRALVRPWPSATPNGAAFGAALDLRAGEVVLATSPLHHSYGVGGLLAALTAGASFVATGGPVSGQMLGELIDAHGVAVVLSIPLLYRWFTAGVPANRPPRLCVSAGAALPEEDSSRWRERVGWRLVEHYGCSELGQLTVAGDDASGSVGVPIPGVELRLAPGPDGPAGEAEVHARLSAPPTALLENPVRLISGWYATGDLGFVDEAGRLFLRGRRGEIVNIAGNKVSLGEVEAAIRGCAGVADCAVVAAGSAGMPPRLHAFVEPSDGFVPAVLTEYLRRNLAPHKVPGVVREVTALPRTSSGKTRRGIVQSWAEDH